MSHAHVLAGDPNQDATASDQDKPPYDRIDLDSFGYAVSVNADAKTQVRLTNQPHSHPELSLREKSSACWGLTLDHEETPIALQAVAYY